MPRLLKNGRFRDNTWLRMESLAELLNRAEVDVSNAQAADKQEVHGTAAENNVLLPLNAWREHSAVLLERSDCGLWLNCDDEPDALPDDLSGIACIAINFPVFTDGRGFSLARLLRERSGYRGELRAVGHIGVDQLEFLRRCGFDAFEMADDTDLNTALACLERFSVYYQ